MSPFQRRKRFCRIFDSAKFFKPQGIPMGNLQINNLELDELEAMHLCDCEGLNQQQAAGRMNISTGTLQRLLYAGRDKLVDAVYTGKAVKIIKHEHIAEYQHNNQKKGGE